MEKEILILNSKLTTFKFDDGRETTVNRVQFAYREDYCEKEKIGFDTIITCSLDADTFNSITKNIKPNEIVKAKLGHKKGDNNQFKIVITRINGIEV